MKNAKESKSTAGNMAKSPKKTAKSPSQKLHKEKAATSAKPKKPAATKKAKESPKKAATRKTAQKKSKAKPIACEDPTLEVVKKCRVALDEKKAEDIKILDVRGKSPITNYFIIATATSEPHLRALSNELEKTLKDIGVKAVGRDYNAGSGWIVVDAFDFMAHIFLPNQRGMYGIENLWKDAEIIRM